MVTSALRTSSLSESKAALEEGSTQREEGCIQRREERNGMYMAGRVWTLGPGSDISCCPSSEVQEQPPI